MAALCSFASLSAAAQAKFVVDNPLNHVGEVMFKTPKMVTFTFTNKGNLNVTRLGATEFHPYLHGIRATRKLHRRETLVRLYHGRMDAWKDSTRAEGTDHGRV